MRADAPGGGGGAVRGFDRSTSSVTIGIAVGSAVLGARAGADQPSARLAIRSNVASPRSGFDTATQTYHKVGKGLKCRSASSSTCQSS